MYIYRNKITGAEVRSQTPCAGENWMLIAEPKPVVLNPVGAAPAPEPPKTAPKKRAKRK